MTWNQQDLVKVVSHQLYFIFHIYQLNPYPNVNSNGSKILLSTNRIVDLGFLWSWTLMYTNPKISMLKLESNLESKSKVHEEVIPTPSLLDMI